MKSWKEFTHFAAPDWAKDHHDVVVVDRQGVVVADFRIVHDCAGWQRFAQKLSAFTAIAVAIETSEGPAVEQLLASGFDIYPINPKSARRYRERKRPSGSKTDRIDAWSLADALRMDGHAWRPLQPLDPLLAELRQLCRDEIALIEERTALINQLPACTRLLLSHGAQSIRRLGACLCLGVCGGVPDARCLAQGRTTKMGTMASC